MCSLLLSLSLRATLALRAIVARVKSRRRHHGGGITAAAAAAAVACLELSQHWSGRVNNRRPG